MFTHTHTIFCCQIYVVRKAPYIVPQESLFKPLQDSNEWEPGSSMQIKRCKAQALGPKLGVFGGLLAILVISSCTLAIDLHTFLLFLLACHLLCPHSPLPLVANTNPFVRCSPAPRRQAVRPTETGYQETKARLLPYRLRRIAYRLSLSKCQDVSSPTLAAP
ncbi:hypothetical protein EDB86DRAFT_2971966 [Lactarius hatsudake]|nr:hypothetical protein EDB86DRAFT_2971966 [Lactarius hatsudake]